MTSMSFAFLCAFQLMGALQVIPAVESVPVSPTPPPATSTPASSGSGEEALLPAFTVDCSASATPSPSVELGALQTGLLTLMDYSNIKHNHFRATILQSCQSPVDYTVLKDNTKWRRYSSEELSSGKPLAEWYSVLVTYDEYLASLESIPIRAIPAPYQQLSLDPATLPTLRALLKALKIEFVSTLQSMKCNCSEKCTIPDWELRGSFSCQDPINNAVRHISDIAKFLGDAVIAMMSSNQCCSSTPPPALDWIAQNIPSSTPDYTVLQKLKVTGTSV